MGWKTFYSVDESHFKGLYDRAEKWGDLIAYKLTIGTEEHYGAGITDVSPTAWMFSPKIQHTIGKTRITVKYYLWVSANVTGEVALGIVFYDNGNTVKDEQGYDLHGVSHTVETAPTENVAEPHELVIEQENNRIVYSVDGNKIGEAQLQGTLASFKLAVQIKSVSNGEIGIIITGVTAEYYDYIEDMINQMMTVMNIMMYVMIGVMVLGVVIRAFKPRKETKGGG